MTALSRKPDHIDLFAVGADIPSDGTIGRTKVYTTWWDGSWHEWGTVGTQTFPINTPVAAIARREDHIDLFAVGRDRRVYTTWWDGSWHNWGTVGTQTFPINTPVAAIARREDHIDLFAVGQDGAGGTAVYTAWWDGSWHEWRKVSDTNDDFPLLTPVTALARKPDHIDLFAVGTDELVHTNWWDGSWHAWGTVGNQSFPKSAAIAALARKPDHIDLFAVGTDELVHTNWWDGSWHAWGTVGNQSFPKSAAIAALARKPDHIDLFAVGSFVNPDDGTTTDTVCTTWWDGSWHDWGQVSDTNGDFPLLTPIAAIARHQEQIDLFSVKKNDEIDIHGVKTPVYSIYSNWWSGSWHAWAPIGGNLSIAPKERQTVVGEVQQGLNFLANTEPKANISFVYDFHFVEVSAAPGDISDYESAEAPWRNAAGRSWGLTQVVKGRLTM